MSSFSLFLFFSVPDGRGWTEGCCFEGRRVQCVGVFRWVCTFLLPARLTQQWGKTLNGQRILKWCFTGLKKSVLAISILNINVSNQAHLYSVIQWPTEKGNSILSFPSSLSLVGHAMMNSDWSIRKRIVPSLEDIYLTAMDTLALNCSLS